MKSAVGCSCKVDFQSKSVGIQLQSFVCKTTTQKIVQDYESHWEINKLVVDDIISCNGESFAFLISRMISLKSNIFGFSVCPTCQIRDKERARLRKVPKKQIQSNNVGGPHPPTHSAEDLGFIEFLKHLLAGGFYAICSVILVPRSSSSSKAYDSVRQKTMVGLLFPTSFSQSMLYFYPDDLESFRRVVFACPSVKVQKMNKEVDIPKISSSTLSSKVLESTEFSSTTRNDKVRKFHENLFDKVRKNADAHQKHLEVLYNESTMVPDLPLTSDIIVVKRSTSLETVLSGLSNLMEDTDTCVDHPPVADLVEMAVSIPQFASNSTDENNREDSSSIFQSLKERSIYHSEQTLESFRLSPNDCEENKNSVNFYTSATRLEDLSEREAAVNTYASLAFPLKCGFVVDDAASTIKFPNLTDETNHSLSIRAKQVCESKSITKQASSSGDNQYSFIGVLSNLVSLFSRSPDKVASTKPLDLEILEGAKLDALLDEANEVVETTNEEDVSYLLRLPSSQSTVTKILSQQDREVENDDDDATVSTIRDDLPDVLMKECLEKENDNSDKVAQKECELIQKTVAAFPKVSSISSNIIGGLWDALFTNNGKNICHIIQDPQIVGVVSAERKKVNKALKDTLKGRLGSDPFFIEILASLALFQVFLNLEWYCMDTSLRQNKEGIKDIVSSVELALQKLSLAMGSPFFQCQYFSNLLSSCNQSDKIIGMSDVISLIRKHYQNHSLDGKIEKLIDEYDEKRRLESLSPDKSIGSQPSTDNESNFHNQKITSVNDILLSEKSIVTNVPANSAKPTELMRTTSLLTRKQPFLGHRMNMGMKRAVTMVTNQNHTIRSIPSKNFKSSDSNLKTGKKRGLEETVTAQKHILKSPNPPKKKRLLSHDLDGDASIFGDESFVSPQTSVIKSRRLIASGEKEVIESTPIQNYLQSKNHSKGTKLFD
eukprot:gene3758-4014_t